MSCDNNNSDGEISEGTTTTNSSSVSSSVAKRERGCSIDKKHVVPLPGRFQPPAKSSSSLSDGNNINSGNNNIDGRSDSNKSSIQLLLRNDKKHAIPLPGRFQPPLKSISSSSILSEDGGGNCGAERLSINQGGINRNSSGIGGSTGSNTMDNDKLKHAIPLPGRFQPPVLSSSSSVIDDGGNKDKSSKQDGGSITLGKTLSSSQTSIHTDTTAMDKKQPHPSHSLASPTNRFDSDNKKQTHLIPLPGRFQPPATITSGFRDGDLKCSRKSTPLVRGRGGSADGYDKCMPTSNSSSLKTQAQPQPPGRKEGDGEMNTPTNRKMSDGEIRMPTNNRKMSDGEIRMPTNNRKMSEGEICESSSNNPVKNVVEFGAVNTTHQSRDGGMKKVSFQHLKDIKLSSSSNKSPAPRVVTTPASPSVSAGSSNSQESDGEIIEDHKDLTKSDNTTTITTTTIKKKTIINNKPKSHKHVPEQGIQTKGGVGRTNTPTKSDSSKRIPPPLNTTAERISLPTTTKNDSNARITKKPNDANSLERKTSTDKIPPNDASTTKQPKIPQNLSDKKKNKAVPTAEESSSIKPPNTHTSNTSTHENQPDQSSSSTFTSQETKAEPKPEQKSNTHYEQKARNLFSAIMSSVESPLPPPQPKTPTITTTTTKSKKDLPLRSPPALFTSMNSKLDGNKTTILKLNKDLPTPPPPPPVFTSPNKLDSIILKPPAVVVPTPCTPAVAAAAPLDSKLSTTPVPPPSVSNHSGIPMPKSQKIERNEPQSIKPQSQEGTTAQTIRNTVSPKKKTTVSVDDMGSKLAQPIPKTRIKQDSSEDAEHKLAQPIPKTRIKQEETTPPPLNFQITAKGNQLVRNLPHQEKPLLSSIEGVEQNVEKTKSTTTKDGEDQVESENASTTEPSDGMEHKKPKTLSDATHKPSKAEKKAKKKEKRLKRKQKLEKPTEQDPTTITTTTKPKKQSKDPSKPKSSEPLESKKQAKKTKPNKDKEVTPPAPSVRVPLTCASLGQEDKVMKAERAVRKLSELVDRPSLNQQNSGSLLLPTKEQIVKGLSGLEIKLKRCKSETDALKVDLKKAQEMEQEEMLKIAKQEKLEQETKERETKEKELQKRKEENEKELQRQKEEKELERLKDVQKQQEEVETLLKKKQVLKEKRLKEEQEQKEKTRQIQQQKAMERRIRVDEEEKKLQQLLMEREASAKSAMDAAHLEVTTARKRAKDADDRVVAKRQKVEQEIVAGNQDTHANDATSNRLLEQADYPLLPNLSHHFFPTLDEPIQIRNLVSSITLDNQRRAKSAHLDSLSAIPYTPKSYDNDSSYSYPNQHRPSLPTNTEWANLARRVMGPSDALYMDATDSPFFDYHASRHEEIGGLIMKSISQNKTKLKKRWMELGQEYAILKRVWMGNQKGKEGKDGKSAKTIRSTNDLSRCSITGKKLSINEQNANNGMSRLDSRYAGAGNRAGSNNAYQRPRRRGGGGVGVGAWSNSSIGGGDVVRSDYEQELIIKEINEKEAMEKRIKFGGSALPRQVYQVEKNLMVSYRDNQTTRRIADPLQESHDLKHVNVWSDVEKCIFLDRFLQYPKDFRKIASSLRNKSTCDCVAFYYNSKKTTPYKAALREHLYRRKRRSEVVGWGATIQAALSMGAKVKKGKTQERPVIFSLPVDDNTFYTREFHPMQREVYDVVTDDMNDAFDLTESDLTTTGCLFSLDDPKLNAALQRSVSQDSLAGYKRKALSSSGNTDQFSERNKIIKSNDLMNVHDRKDMVVDTSIVNNMANNPHSRKAPQKWSQAEKTAFFETIEKHGKNWSLLVDAVGTKSVSQIKNYYYDHKKQFGKQQQRQGGDASKLNDDTTSLEPLVDAAINLSCQHSIDTHTNDQQTIRIKNAQESFPLQISQSQRTEPSSSMNGFGRMESQMTHQTGVAPPPHPDTWIPHKHTSSIPISEENQQAAAAHVSLGQIQHHHGTNPHNNMVSSSQSQQNIISNIPNVIPWMTPAQVAQVHAAAMQQQQQQQQKQRDPSSMGTTGVRDSWIKDDSMTQQQKQQIKNNMNFTSYSLGQSSTAQTLHHHHHVAMPGGYPIPPNAATVSVSGHHPMGTFIPNSNMTGAMPPNGTEGDGNKASTNTLQTTSFYPEQNAGTAPPSNTMVDRKPKPSSMTTGVTEVSLSKESTSIPNQNHHHASTTACDNLDRIKPPMTLPPLVSLSSAAANASRMQLSSSPMGTVPLSSSVQNPLLLTSGQTNFSKAIDNGVSTEPAS